MLRCPLDLATLVNTPQKSIKVTKFKAVAQTCFPVLSLETSATTLADSDWADVGGFLPLSRALGPALLPFLSDTALTGVTRPWVGIEVLAASADDESARYW